MNIVVLGYIVRGPLGGMVWHHLQYVLGLTRLGHNVLFVEDSGDYPSCYNPSTGEVSADAAYGMQFIDKTFKSVGLNSNWAYYDAHTDNWHGQNQPKVVNFCESADLLINLSGINCLRSWLEPIKTRLLIDTDPVFTQIKHLSKPDEKTVACEHTHYFSFGENFGAPDCTIPDDGFPWQPTRQPVVTACWANQTQVVNSGEAKITSILQWDSYRPAEFDGSIYGMKSQSFTDYMELPSSTSVSIELAIGSDSAPRGELAANGWLVQDPLVVTKTSDSYRSYIAQSAAEFNIAKHGYVVSNSGWFSERSANYLASGKPVIAQSTGFEHWMPTGFGVLPFSSPAEALAAIEEVQFDYQLHSSAATELARECFDHEVVLTKLLDCISSPQRLSEAS